MKPCDLGVYFVRRHFIKDIISLTFYWSVNFLFSLFNLGRLCMEIPTFCNTLLNFLTEYSLTNSSWVVRNAENLKMLDYSAFWKQHISLNFYLTNTVLPSILSKPVPEKLRHLSVTKMCMLLISLCVFLFLALVAQNEI